MTTDPGEQKALEDIEAYGCHVIHVIGDEDAPPFSYSVGVHKTSGAPEVIVIGLKHELAHSIINEYNRRVQAGQHFAPGALYEGFIQGFQIQFEVVRNCYFDEYLGWNKWLYKGSDFEALQLVYPTTAGVWPWQSAASEWFRRQQPLLARSQDD